MSHFKEELLSFLLSLSIVVLVTALLYIILFIFCGLEKRIILRVSIIMIALCINDYLEYYDRKRETERSHHFSYNLNRFFKRSRLILFFQNHSIGLLFVFVFVWTVLSGLFVNAAGDPLPDIMKDRQLIQVVVIGLILAPLIETLLFQVLIIEGCRKVTPKIDGDDNLVFPILVSSIAFASVHGYSLDYIGYAFLTGLGYSFLYSLVSIRPNKSWIQGFWAVVLLHLTSNSLAFIALLFYRLS